MLDQSTRAAVLRLREEGHGTREIARTLGISRGGVKRVIASARAEVPEVVRAEKAAPPPGVAVHAKLIDANHERVIVPEHRSARGDKVATRRAPSVEERELASAGEEVAAYVSLLKKRGRSIRALRQLVRIVRDYPREPALAAIRIATHYGLDDLDRLESLVLRHVASEFFPLPPPEPEDEQDPRDERGAGSDDDPAREDDDDR